MKILSLLLTLFFSAHALAEEPKVIVHLFDDREPVRSSEKNPPEGYFWIDWCEHWRGIAKTKEVTGEDAKKLIAAFKKSLTASQSMNNCGHNPIYGIEVTHEDGSTMKTSLCFSCTTWVKPKTRMAITGEHGVNNELCKKLREVIDLPEEMLPEAKTKKK